MNQPGHSMPGSIETLASNGLLPREKVEGQGFRVCPVSWLSSSQGGFRPGSFYRVPIYARRENLTRHPVLTLPTQKPDWG